MPIAWSTHTADLLQRIKALNLQKQNQQIAFNGPTAHC